jgi:CMP-N-acetylneuraminic acid synthetase|tara:strand:- start:1119 stop:1835 length:717 start_codon:yes stop_codon:yes gene_type:complete
MKSYKILAIIPARGGSKGIRRKNLQKLSGKPLIAHTIIAAKKTKSINKIIVSTDDKEIGKISKNNGAEVPFLRPKQISKDTSSIIEVIKHALKFLQENQSYVPDIIILLQPTSPLRTSQLITKTINTLKKSKATSVITVSKITKHPYAAYWLKNDFLKPFEKNFTKYSRRQEFPDLFFPTGAVYTFWYDTLKKFNSLHGPKIKPIVVHDEDIDIDNLRDLFFAEMMLKNWKKYKKNLV